MKGTTLYKLLRWIVASSVSLLAFPISVFIIIFSLYPDLATVNQFNRLGNFYNLCDTTRKDRDFIKRNPVRLHSNIPPKRINKNHLLVIDQTLSTVFEDNQLDSLKKYLKLSLRHEINSNSIKSLIYTKIIETYELNYNCDTLLVYFYNGSKNNPHKVLNSINKDAFTPDILQCIEHSETIKEQKTDFRVILDTVKNIIKSHKLDCITLLSDFYHEAEPDLMNSDFCNLKKISGNIKFNLIALWMTSYTGKNSARRVQRQNNFVAKFDEYFLGVVATEKLFLDKYQNSLFTHNGDFYEFEEIITYTPQNNFGEKNDSDSSIFLYSPITNNLKYNDTQVKIIMDTKTKFHWKIKSIFGNSNAFVKFNHNCNTSNSNKCRLNQWYEEECDSLLLSIKQDHSLNIDDLKFCYVVNDSGINKFEECNIEVKNIFVDKSMRMNLLIFLNLSIVLLIIFISSSEILIAINLFYNEYEQ